MAIESAPTMAQEAAVSDRPSVLRYAAVALVVGLYIGLGFLLRPDPNTYLLLGMPITIFFQIIIARRPLRELWLRHGKPLRCDRWTMAWLLLFLIGPIQAVVDDVRVGSWPVTVYGLAAIIGAVGAALAFRVLGASSLRQLGFLLLLLIPIGLARLLLQFSIAGEGIHDLALLGRLWTAL